MTINMLGLTSHTYEGATVRTSSDSNGNPLFVAKDVCEILGLQGSKGSDNLRALDDDETVSIRVDTGGGAQTMIAVTESGLYALVFRSNKPEARRFRKWVTSELLPAIRKQGFYALAGAAELNEVARLEMELRAAKLRLEASALIAKAREPVGLPVGSTPPGYIALLDFVAEHGWEATPTLRSQLLNRTRRLGKCILQRVPRTDKGQGSGRTRVRRLWPTVALKQAARDAGLLPALGEKGGA